METTRLKPFTLNAQAMLRWFLQEAGAPRFFFNAAILVVTRVLFALIGTPPFVSVIYFVCYLALAAYVAVLAAGLIFLSSTQKKAPYTEQTVEFDDTTLTASYSGETGTMAISKLVDAKEFKEFFVLAMGKGRLCIPKSAFENEDDMIRFRENLQRQTKYQDRRKTPFLSWQLKR